MNDSMFIAATGMHMQQKNVDTIANNLANINTAGFKKGRVTFQDLVRRELVRASTNSGPDGAPNISQGNGVALASLSKLFTPGELKKTDLPLDMAIQGEGFFEVVGADGAHAYTRGGSLIVDKDGFLAAADGSVLKPSIRVGLDAKEITVKSDGRVLVKTRDQADATEVGRLELARFSDTSGLVSLGGGLYRPSERSGDAIYGKPGEEGLGKVSQGFVEASNVQLVEEMVNL